MSQYSSPKEQEGAVTALVMYLPRKISNGYKYASGRSGGIRILKPIALTYCALLAVESLYISTPAIKNALSGSDAVQVDKRDMRFVWKPFIDDGADMSRLSPLPNISRVTTNWLPIPTFIKSRIASSQETVWNNWGEFIAAATLALLIQYIEALVWRKVTEKQSRDEFNKFNDIKKVTASKDSVAVARLKAAQHNQYGSGNTAIRFFMVVILYLLEIGAFRTSFGAAGALWAQVVYGFLTVFGFEVFDRMFDEEE